MPAIAMAGLYIHIPFCKSRCIYCGFFSTTSPELQDRYVDALCKEMSGRRGDISTVYIGGGTPSQLSLANMRRLTDRIFHVYNVDDDAEITVECNPDDISNEYVAMLRQSGVNRISMGAQTFADDRLRFLHRRHTAKQTEDAVSTLRDAGIGNISIDLMFGFPGETIEEWNKDIDDALALDVEHISAYSLMFEENTPLKHMLDNGEISETDDNTSLAMYDMLINKLVEAGYEHYEISNFARPGRRSRHNGSYWKGIPYIGIGAGAHSYDLKTRRWNICNLVEYIKAMDSGTDCYDYEIIDDNTRFNETVMTSLRTVDGLDIRIISEQFGKDKAACLLDSAGRQIKNGTLAYTDGMLRLTRKGLYISNMVISDLMIV